ncbi:hypothetical protein [Lusitaniella coriacea]|uniref:hypothetical protein n=1 Tax=Lusitaniella coriacea TaxID=1983105 RepID=UPI003CF5B39A
MPKKLLFIASFGALSLLMGGCEALSFLPWFGGEEETVESVETEPTESPVAQAPSTTEPFTEPVQPAKTNNTPPNTGLIPSTSPEQRTKLIKERLEDPFSTFPATPNKVPRRVIISRNGAQGGGNGGGTSQLPPIPQVKQPPRPATKTPSPATKTPQQAKPKAAPNTGSGSGSLARKPNLPTPPNAIPDFPPILQPTAADGVKVTGVIKVGGVPHAIVQAPGQESRYVKSGDYLANGQVLVKRIEMGNGTDPIVILEQAGVEVAKRIGEGAEIAPSDSASLPQSPQQNI